MKRKWLIVVLIVAIAASVGVIWWYERRSPEPTEVVMFEKGAPCHGCPIPVRKSRARA